MREICFYTFISNLSLLRNFHIKSVFNPDKNKSQSSTIHIKLDLFSL